MYQWANIPEAERLEETLLSFTQASLILRLKTQLKNNNLSTTAGASNQFLSSFSLLRVESLEILIHYSLQL